MQLSILIPARQEMFLAQTVQDILAHREGDTEIIVVLDGAPADPPLPVDSRIRVIEHKVSIGQRAATNEAARASNAEFVMKVDAHCAFDQGFDVKLIAPYLDGRIGKDVTSIPRMYNLHAFDWECPNCGNRTYQGMQPAVCDKCKKSGEFKRVMVWKPRRGRMTDFARFDGTLHFQYWGAYGKRPEAQGDIADVMCCVGAAWMMPRERYWQIDGMDEGHGSWGQMGVELACKSWLSGGRQVVNKTTWFSHLFRTQPGFGFPYQISGSAQEYARQYSQKMWRLEAPDEMPHWDKAIHPLSWLIKKFAPVPEWEVKVEPVSKGVIYYTDGRLDSKILLAVQEQLKKSGLPIVSATLKPMDFGKNVVVNGERGYLTMFKQQLAALEASTADVIFMCEHDILYHPSHFEFTPSSRDTFFYNLNVWKMRVEDGHSVKVDFCQQVSGLCAYRELLIEHYRKRVERVEREGRYDHHIGFEPGTHTFPRGIDDHHAESWSSPYPNIDIRHGGNMTSSRWSPTQFRNQKYTKGWVETDDEIPGWGKAKDIIAGLK